MKIVLDTKNFVDSISWVTKTLDTKDDKSFILFVMNADGEGYVSHINRLSYIKSMMNAETIELNSGEDEVKLAFDAQFIKRFVSVLKNYSAPLVFEKDLNDKQSLLEVTRPQESYTIPLFSSPKTMKEPEYEKIGSVSDSEFFDALNKLSKLSDSVNSGAIPAIGSVSLNFNKEDKTITAMATDRYSLGEFVLPFSPVEAASFYDDDENIVLISESYASMVSAPKVSAGSVDVLFDSKTKKLGYDFGDGRVVLFALTAAKPLPYQGIKKKAEGNDSIVVVSLSDLKNAISTVSRLSYDEMTVVLSINKDSFVVSDEKNSNTVSVSVDKTEGIDEEINVSFVRDVLVETITPISGDKIQIKIGNVNFGFLFVPLKDDNTVVDNVFLMAMPSESSEKN